ncbi:MAG: N-acetylneuraminate synthase family protein, partial [Thermodesulfobacteriota bacterium]
MEKIKVADRLIGEEESCFIIAEAGSNHNGDLNQAKELINIAASAGVDAVKFQIFSADMLYSEKSAAFPIIRENELPREWLGELTSYAKDEGIIFL